MTARALLAFVCMSAVALAENPRTYRLQWDDLGRLVRGKTVEVTLPSDIRLKGNITSMEADELRMEVKKTSDKRAYPKGLSIIPRSQVRRLRVFEKSNTWKVAGTAVGASIGGFTAGPLAIGMEGNIPAYACLLAAAVPTAIGYLLGWAADRRVTDIDVVP